ncbi:pyridoxal-dependent decarboxylase [Pseudonocardia sp. ICBG1293]|uniref:pyridoxal phosphate-dependent decarboxylase family protein n=1 Tax=Pseudonocardia sp. ICBG1293 TaxID=2844382 RepID=UPI001CCE814A|nr:pyridoxal-dependent decarboxylase [Pseudonocardia sp. ICBG1293]
MSLVLTDGERRLANELLGRFMDGYERDLADRPIVPEVDRDTLRGLLDEPFPAQGVGVEGFFRDLDERILPNSTTVSHPRFLAYVLGPPHGIGAHAEAVAATLNQNCNFWQLSPAASVIERRVLDWFAGLLGFDTSRSAGILTAGGSIATLDALTTALHDRRPHFREQGLQAGGPPLVVYTSAEAHRCVDKAAGILGLGLDNVVRIPTDGNQRMRVDLLAEAVRADRAAGREPFCVVATSGTVTTGAVDPIAEIADLAGAENLWLHVDGAYGALFVLAERAASRFAAVRRADPVALDPHKLLFAPLESGCLLVKDGEKLRRTYAYSSSYLTVQEDPLMRDYMDYGPQLSRNFKALKIWAALRTFGTDAFRSALGEMLDLSTYMGERIEREPSLRLMAPVTLTAVCVQVPGLSHDGHTALLARLAAEGTALLGPAVVDGGSGMRACITNHRTTRSDIDAIVDRLVELAEVPAEVVGPTV